jgi:hypothetical protein
VKTKNRLRKILEIRKAVDELSETVNDIDEKTERAISKSTNKLWATVSNKIS